MRFWCCQTHEDSPLVLLASTKTTRKPISARSVDEHNVVDGAVNAKVMRTMVMGESELFATSGRHCCS